MMPRKPKTDIEALLELQASLRDHAEVAVPASLRAATLQRIGLRPGRAKRTAFARLALPLSAVAALALILWQPSMRPMPQVSQPALLPAPAPLPHAHSAKKSAAAPAPALVEEKDIAPPSVAEASQPMAAGAPAAQAPSAMRAAAADSLREDAKSTDLSLKLFNNVFKASSGQTFSAQLMLDQAGPVTAIIVDAHGGVVARLFEASTGPGPLDLAWSGLTAEGKPAPSAAYTLIIRAEGKLAKAHLVLLR